MKDIDGNRLLADLKTLSEIGGLPGGGIDRLAWSDADLAGRRWYAERIRQAGLEPRVDQALNVFGHLPRAPGPFVLTGSHLDSVPRGGRLDGAYGAVAALEVLRTLVESRDPMAERVEVVGFADEEGVRFNAGVIGSLALAGELDLDQLRSREDWQGIPIPQVLAKAGCDLDGMAAAAQHLASIKAFVELHVEQGPRMEAVGLQLAVVTGIVGTHRERITITGTQNHAGTTPFRLRRDAGRAAARAAAELSPIIQAINQDATANIGWIRFDPGGINVIPGEAVFTLDVRHLEEPIIRQLVDAFHTRLAAICAEEGCRAHDELLAWTPPAPMEPGMMEALDRACLDAGEKPGRLWSGAGHDAAVLSRHAPTGMLFVPSIGGVSHAPAEATSDRHLVLGTRALLRAVRAVASRIK